MICTQLYLGNLSVRVGDGSRHSEEIVKRSRIVPLNVIIIIIIIIVQSIQSWSTATEECKLWMESFVFLFSLIKHSATCLTSFLLFFKGKRRFRFENKQYKYANIYAHTTWIQTDSHVHISIHIQLNKHREREKERERERERERETDRQTDRHTHDTTRDTRVYSYRPWPLRRGLSVIHRNKLRTKHYILHIW